MNGVSLVNKEYFSTIEELCDVLERKDGSMLA
jgi:hypothetical protein